MKNNTVDIKEKNIEKRNDYLVVQGNDLAKSFGILTSFEHQVLDYCTSFVKKESDVAETFTLNIKEFLRHLNLYENSGRNYNRVIASFKKLNENTPLYIPIMRDNVAGIMMTNLFDNIVILKNGTISFKFSENLKEYLFELKTNFYCLKLEEVLKIKTKSGKILLKLWASYRFRNNKKTTIYGSFDEWESWFLGKDKRIEAGIFKRNHLKKAIKELEEKLAVDITLNSICENKRTIAYEMIIIDEKSSNEINDNLIASDEFIKAMDLWRD